MSVLSKSLNECLAIQKSQLYLFKNGYMANSPMVNGTFKILNDIDKLGYI